MADWDDEEYEAPLPLKQAEKVKESWSDEEEETEEPQPAVAAVAPEGSFRKLQKEKQQKEKERKEQGLSVLTHPLWTEEKERAAILAAAAGGGKVVMTAEEEKKRRQKMVEEADHQLTAELFGGTTGPKTSEDFAELAKQMGQKLLKYELSPHFPVFLGQILSEASVNLKAEEIKKIVTAVSLLHRHRGEAERKADGKGKKKGGARVVVKNRTQDLLDVGLEHAGGLVGDVEDELDFM